MGLDTPVLDYSQLSNAVSSAKNVQIKPGMSADQARQAAEDFEAVYISQMLSPMFDSLDNDGYFGGGPGDDIYRSMLVEQYGKSIAQAGGFGLADAVQREILRLQEAAQP
ncbi:MAG: rod-binding protein [Alphaproteobacteria bacterium]